MKFENVEWEKDFFFPSIIWIALFSMLWFNLAIETEHSFPLSSPFIVHTFSTLNFGSSLNIKLSLRIENKEINEIHYNLNRPSLFERWLNTE